LTRQTAGITKLDVVIDKTDCWHHQTVYARKNTILEGVKAIGIPHHDCSPNYLSNKHCGSVAIFANLQSLIIESGLSGAVLMSPNAITSFNMVTQI
jgi:hypothetical protein